MSVSITGATLYVLSFHFTFFLSIELKAVIDWLNKNFLSINLSKTNMVNFAINNLPNPEILTLTVDGSILTHSNEVKFLGIILDNNLKFYNHIDHVSKKISSGIFALRRLAAVSDTPLLLTAYYGLIFPHLNYGVAIWGNESTRTKLLFRLQKKSIRTVFKKPYRYPCKEIFKSHRILTFPSLYILQAITFVKKF